MRNKILEILESYTYKVNHAVTSFQYLAAKVEAADKLLFIFKAENTRYNHKAGKLKPPYKRTSNQLKSAFRQI